ncbi:alpha/beta hydrolase [Streptomyces roseolus]|uniref:alpha/beta hydrolase n=1 Tax=Streptomyces roseolus TaxID=67358 RepID=UPI0037011DEB
MTAATLTWQQLRDLRTSELTEAGDAWHQVSNRSDADRTRVDRAMSAKLRETQESESAEAALGRLKRLSRNFQYLHSECGLVRTTLNGLAVDLAEPQTQLKNALADASAQGLTVHEDGSVSYPAAEVTDLAGTAKQAPGGTVRGSARLPLEAPPLGSPQGGFPGFLPLNPNQAKAQSVADRIARALRSAGEVDARYAKTLIGLKAEKGLDVTEATLKDVRLDTADVRGTAGMYLGEDVPTDKSPAERKKWWDGLTDEQREEYLEVAPDVSYGNPDTSKNVSAYVPGLGTKLNEEFVDDTMKRAQDTARGARRLDPSSASIIWLGYDAPQHVDVMTRGDAQRGAPAYNEFMAGLSATNQNKDPHVTAIGHSYGSLTVGTAAQRSGGIPGADDIILLGSPGVDAQKAEELGVGKDHVFVGAADNDPVTHLPSKDEAAMGWLTSGPVGVLVARDLWDIGDDDVYFGKDPASEAFDARRFKVDDGPRMVWDRGGFDAHSQYFTPELDPESANNVARIVAGRPEKITTEEHR